MLRFVDSFDHYTLAAEFLSKYNIRNGGGSSHPTISAGNGRNSTASMRLTSSGNGTGWLHKVLDAQQTWIMGFSFKPSSITCLNSPGGQIASFMDGDTTQCDLRLQNTGQLRVTRGNNVTVLGTTTNALSAGQTYYIEWKLKIDNTTGTVDVRVNGESWLSLTGQDTQNTTNATANGFILGVSAYPTSSFGTAGTFDYDDVYVCDTQGSNNNDFMGDVRIQATLPSGAGTTTNFTPSAGSNYENVDDATPNDNTDYNYSLTAGHIDTYVMGDIAPSAGTIKGIAVQMRARKDDAGTRTIAAAIRTGGTDYFGSNKNIGTDYTYYTEIWEINPNTSVGFSIADINGLEAGAKVIA